MGRAGGSKGFLGIFREMACVSTQVYGSFRYKVASKMEVDLVQTEINSIQAEIVLYQEKQYQTLFIFASHMTVID